MVTVTVAGAVTLPEVLVAVSVYVVVLVGLTTVLVPVTGPTFASMLRLVAPDTTQDKVLLCPAPMPAGVAVKLLIVGAGTGGVLLW